MLSPHISGKPFSKRNLKQRRVHRGVMKTGVVDNCRSSFPHLFSCFPLSNNLFRSFNLCSLVGWPYSLATSVSIWPKLTSSKHFILLTDSDKGLQVKPGQKDSIPRLLLDAKIANQMEDRSCWWSISATFLWRTCPFIKQIQRSDLRE